VHLVSFITKKFVTMHGHINVEFHCEILLVGSAGELNDKMCEVHKPTLFSTFLPLHRAFLRFIYHYTPTNAPNIFTI
jgi:hypothetical protein